MISLSARSPRDAETDAALSAGLPAFQCVEKTGFDFNDCASRVGKRTTRTMPSGVASRSQSPLFVLALMVAPLLVVVTVGLWLTL